MMTLKISAEVTANHQLIVALPPEFAVGQKLDVEVTLRQSPNGEPYAQPGLLEWAEQNAEHWGDAIRSDDVEGFTGRRY